MLQIFEESTVQKERFRVAANKLLNQCFLLKNKENTRKDYIFVRQNKDMFISYFELLGYDIKLNEEQGVIALVSQFTTGRLNLGKYESIFLLILRLLYLEKRKQLENFSTEVTVLIEEIREKYSLLKVKSKPVMDKALERQAISLLKKYNIVQNLDTDLNQPDTRIIIYPAVLMAVPVENINKYFEQVEQKLAEYAGGKTDE